MCVCVIEGVLGDPKIGGVPGDRRTERDLEEVIVKLSLDQPLDTGNVCFVCIARHWLGERYL